LIQAASVNPSVRAETRASRSYYAILEIDKLSTDDNGFEHILTVQNELGATNYTFRLEVLGTEMQNFISICLKKNNTEFILKNSHCGQV
jgi:hypothetical protein